MVTTRKEVLYFFTRRPHPLAESAKLCLEGETYRLQTQRLFSALRVRISRTVVHQQQHFSGANVLCTLVAFNSRDEISLETLSKNLRVHPSASLRLVNDVSAVMFTFLKTSWLCKFSNHNWFQFICSCGIGTTKEG